MKREKGPAQISLPAISAKEPDVKTEAILDPPDFPGLLAHTIEWLQLVLHEKEELFSWALGWSTQSESKFMIYKILNIITLGH